MSKHYPLFPELPEEAQQQAADLVERFKKAAMKALEESMATFYSETLEYIESDSWFNFRDQIMEGFKNYNNRKIQNAYDFDTIRKEIYKQFRDELIVDLNQDLLKKIEQLEREVDRLRKANDDLIARNY